MEASAFEAMAFRYPWRHYQARALAELDTHLTDDKLHVVAAPGAGKTVLGLEIIRRLAKRTLILAPSLLVRDQWILRLSEDFLDGEPVDWVSTDLSSDVAIRVSTYQNLHTNRMESYPTVDLLCLDEAHHLRRAWWTTLTNLTARDRPTTLSLTATPPYDADAREWRNYTALCGPVDTEISVPELVQSGDLCPHQDLVYLAPTATSAAYDTDVQTERALFQQLAENAELLDRVAQDPWIRAPKDHADTILANPARFSALLVYLRHNALPIPNYARRLLQVNDAAWPPLDWAWLGTLFDEFPKENLPLSVIERLRKAGALRNDKITLPPPKHADRLALLKNDRARLGAVREIYEAEKATRGDDLRMAVLVDRIGRLALRSSAAEIQFNAVGLFRSMLAENDRARMAMLTGQLAILPSRLADGLDARPLPDAADYVALSGTALLEVVPRVNQAFAAGEIELLIGTHAFLGQGWDAPALNTLVMATRLKSFVAVNQIRGRALRVFPARPEKTASIWHMAITPDQHTEGEDIELLRRRFSCFVRLDLAAGVIHSDLSLEPRTDAQTKRALSDAARLQRVRAAWCSATAASDEFEPSLKTQTTLTAPHSMGVVPVPAFSPFARLLRALGQGPTEAQMQKSLGRMAKLVITSLLDIAAVTGSAESLQATVSRERDQWQIWLRAACRMDEALFHEDLQEVFGAIDRPRYIIHVKTGLLLPDLQYFAVPGRFSSNKTRAEVFWRNWQSFIGRGDLIYTRTVIGRAALQAARISSARWNSSPRLIWT